MDKYLDRLDAELDKDEADLASTPIPVCDNARHLVCYPYSLANLHKVAAELGIKRCWFHKNHYDIPLRRRKEIEEQCMKADSREIVQIIRGVWDKGE